LSIFFPSLQLSIESSIISRLGNIPGPTLQKQTTIIRLILFTASMIILESMEVVTCARSVDIEAYILSFAPALGCLSVLCLYLSECSDRPAHRVVEGQQC
jgi:hypothetical protein